MSLISRFMAIDLRFRVAVLPVSPGAGADYEWPYGIGHAPGAVIGPAHVPWFRNLATANSA